MLAVVTCFFNFAGFTRPQANLHRFLRQMKRDGVDVFGVEAATSEHKFTQIRNSRWKRVQVSAATQSLWQKEAAINLASKMLGPEYTAVAWIDADVWFSNPNWVSDTLKELENNDVVQMFEKCIWTSPTGETELTKPTVAKTPLDQSWRSHPGFAWAMRRELWDKAGGLYPFALSGGGDTIMTLAFQNSKLWDHARKHTGINREPYDAWAANFKGAKIGFTPGTLYHEWHGSRKDRDYVGRCERVSKVDVTKDLRVASNGLLEWTETADKKLIAEVRQYFTSRNDDSA